MITLNLTDEEAAILQETLRTYQKFAGDPPEEMAQVDAIATKLEKARAEEFTDGV